MPAKIKSILILVLLLMSAPSIAQITVFPDCNFLGNAVTLPVGNYTRADLIRRGLGDNALSSVIVSDGFVATIYENDRFRGRRGTVTAFSQCLDEDGFNDNVSSISVQPVNGSTATTELNNTGGNYVEVFTDCNYGGRSATLKPGEYTTEHLRQLGISSNAISSIRVPQGLEIAVYINDFYRGRSGKLAADNQCLPKRFNDVISSVVVSGEAVFDLAESESSAYGDPVLIYTECNFQGKSAQIYAGEYGVSDLGKLGFPDNSIASFRVPEGMELEIFANDFQRGASSLVSESVPCLTGTRFDGQISSANVRETELVSASVTNADQGRLAAAVTLYTDCEYRGDTASVATGEYRRVDLVQMGIRDNSISAMRISDGYRVKVYDNDFFRGGTLTLTASESCLENKRADDAISSLVVEEIGVDELELQVMTAAEEQQLNEGLTCVKKYVEKDLCTSDAWSVMSNFCQLGDVALMSDGYLEGHVNKGNCITKNWKELTHRISNPEAR